MTKKFYSAVLAGTAALAVGLGASSANAATTSANATAEIVEPITITQNAPLNFGTIVPSATADTVEIESDGDRVCGTNVTCSGTAAAGAFTAEGTGGKTVLVTLPATTTTLSRAGGGASMNVSGLNVSSGTLILSAGTTGTATFSVGGILSVGASQMAGVYNGTYNVSVNYQ